VTEGSQRFVLDASALLAHMHNEPGGLVVDAAMATGAVMSVMNYAEALSKLAETGRDPTAADALLRGQGIIGGSVELIPTTEEDALTIARLRTRTRAQGLSLGDRTCLATGLRLAWPVLTADRSWAAIQVGVTVSLIRP
jgi:ribonuclease VapC